MSALVCVVVLDNIVQAALSCSGMACGAKGVAEGKACGLCLLKSTKVALYTYIHTYIRTWQITRLIAGQIQHQVRRLVLCRRPVGDTDIRTGAALRAHVGCECHREHWTHLPG